MIILYLGFLLLLLVLRKIKKAEKYLSDKHVYLYYLFHICICINIYVSNRDDM